MRLGLTLLIFAYKIVTFGISTFRKNLGNSACAERHKICEILECTRQNVLNSRRYAPKCMNFQEVRDKSYEIPEGMWKMFAGPAGAFEMYEIPHACPSENAPKVPLCVWG